MLSLTHVVAGAVPCLLWLFWIHRKDDHEPEPRHLVIAVFLLGGLAALFLGWARPRIESWFLGGSDVRELLLDAFIVTALCEETMKFLAFATGALWHTEWDEPLDGIIYGAAAGLGFAAIENAYYFAATGEVEVVLWRAFTSTLAHMSFSAGLGFFLGLVRLGRIGWIHGALLGVGYAVLLHGSYDVLLFTQHLARAGLLVGLPILLIGTAWKIRWARKRSEEYHPA